MSARSKAKSQLPATRTAQTSIPAPPRSVLSEIIERGARVQGPAVRAYVERLRDGNPDATPAEIVTKLEKHYLAAVMASGAAVGSAAAFPGIGTLVALSAVAGETVVFLEATAVFVLAVAEVHGIPAEHRERRRALVLAVLVGEDSKHAVADLLGPGRTSGAWLSRRRGDAAAACGVAAEFAAAAVLRQALRAQARGDRVRQAAAGRHRRGRRRRRQPADGQAIIENARMAFGIPPPRWPAKLHVLPSPQELITTPGRLALLWRPRLRESASL